MQKSAAIDIEVVPYRWVILAMMVACFLFTFIIRFTWPPLIPVVVPALNMKMAQAKAFMSAFYFGSLLSGQGPTVLRKAAL